MQENKNRSQLTDSPWFWAYLFTTAALIGLLIAGPKYLSRQTQLERRFLARQEGGQTVKGPGGETIEPPTPDNLILTLGPLFLICSCLLLIAWSRLWLTQLQRRKQRSVAERSADDRDAASSERS